MKKILIGLSVLLGLCVLAAAAFTLGNKAKEASGGGEASAEEEQVLTGEPLSVASLPLLYAEIGGQKTSVLHGQVKEHDFSTEEIPLIPVSDSKLSLKASLYGNEIRSISYAVRLRGVNGTWQEGTFDNWDSASDTLDLNADLEQPLSPEQDYLLDLKVEMASGRQVWYYARLKSADSALAGSVINYVMKFHGDTFSYDRVGNVTGKLEKDGSADLNTLAMVNIHCSGTQLAWGDLAPEETGGTMNCTILEMDSTFASIRLNYEVTAGSTGESYQVSEYFSLRYENDSFFLMNYRRDITELFSENSQRIRNGVIDFGILDPDDVSVDQSSDGRYVAFGVGGEMWCYDTEANELVKVFSFRDEDDLLRSGYVGHGVKLLDVEDDGSVNFLLYGYMNRGKHEGDTGIVYMRYDAASNILEERFYLPYTGALDTLRDEVSTLAAMAADGRVYVSAGDRLYVINWMEHTCEVMVDEISEKHLVVNAAQSAIAWVEGTEEDSSRMVMLLYLDTGETQGLSVADGEWMVPEGFIDDDCVLGKGIDGATCEVDGESRDLRYCVFIQSRSGSRELTYQYEGIYIYNVKVMAAQIELGRVKEIAGVYTETEKDILMQNRGTNTDGLLTLTSASDEERMTVWKLKGIQEPESGIERSMKISDGINHDTADAWEMETVGGTSGELEYYAYAEGERRRITSTAGEAIAEVFDAMGAVWDSNGNPVWYRGTLPKQKKINLSQILTGTRAESLKVCVQILAETVGATVDPDVITSDMTAMEAVNAVMPGAAINLTDAPMRALLFYVKRDQPLLVIDSQKNVRLINGFDIYSIRFYDPTKGEASNMKQAEAEEYLKSGCTVIGVLPSRVRTTG